MCIPSKVVISISPPNDIYSRFDPLQYRCIFLGSILYFSQSAFWRLVISCRTWSDLDGLALDIRAAVSSFTTILRLIDELIS